MYSFNTAPCDDNNTCTEGDTCKDGVCTGTGDLDCNDQNPCTKDICLPDGGCVYEDLFDQVCDDGDPCTVGDACLEGACAAGAPKDCDDLNPCTDDSCDDAGDCINAANTIDCSDDNACTEGDHCEEGACIYADLVDCDDNNPCTDDWCEPLSGCMHQDNMIPCNDGDACTAGDLCAEGICAGEAVTCDDDNLCTDDTCEPLSGCIFTPNAADCDDGNACTAGDHCGGGACIFVGPVECNDGIFCTDDACEPLSGCIFTPDDAECDDGIPCNGLETCNTQEGCVDGAAVDCDDEDACTDDSCVEGCPGEVFLDHCYVAVAEEGLWADAKAACQAMGGHLASIAGAPEQGIVWGVIVATCDGDAWVGGNDIEEEGVWVWTDDTEWTGYTNWYGGDGPPDEHPLADALKIHNSAGIWFNLRTDLTAPCYVCEFGMPQGVCEHATVACDDGVECTVDSCDPDTGDCVYVPEADACDDGDLCTDDSCDPDLGCVFTDIELDCTGLDGDCTEGVCDPDTGECIALPANGGGPCSDEEPCTEDDVCVDGACAGAPKDCDDEDPCTDDSCTPQVGCVHVNNTEPCDDDNACTVTDLCFEGACVGSGAPNCGDDDICTDDSCDPLSGCINTFNTAPCDDGNACNVTDACVDGVCVGTGVVNCDDDNLCTDDTCDTDQGCLFANNTNPCDDDDPCTVGDTCGAADCQSGSGKLDCNDDVACTADSCEAGVGCTSVPVDAACDDDIACTVDSCDAEAGCANDPVDADCDDDLACTLDVCDPDIGCVGNPVDADCDDDNECTDDVCDPDSGCGYTNVTNGTPCSDGDGECTFGVCVLTATAFHTYQNEGRTVSIYKSDPDNVPLSSYEEFCEEQGLAWFVPKSQADAQALIDNAYALDNHQTWIITKNNTTAGTFGGYSVTVDDTSCMDYSSSGFSAIRKWSCSYCDPEQYDSTSCWDTSHTYDWLVCEPDGGGAFKGFASWSQNAAQQSDVQQDAVMDAACDAAYSGSHAASIDEIIDGLVTGLPGTNTSGQHLLGVCPNCEGDTYSGAVDGHARKCVNPSANWPTSLGSGWNGWCIVSTRTAICII